MDSVPCEACGCTEYTQHSGFYICNNCDTQSQVSFQKLFLGLKNRGTFNIAVYFSVLKFNISKVFEEILMIER